MNPKRAFAVSACTLACALLMYATEASAGSFRYTELRPSGENAINAAGVDDADQVVGSYEDSEGYFHGYVWAKGVFTQVDGGTNAELVAVNARGIAAGQYIGAAFTYDIRTSQQQTLPPSPKYRFSASGINIHGTVVGQASADQRGRPRGFIAKAGGVSAKLLKVPGVTFWTSATAINDSGVVVGYYEPSKTTTSGFTYQSGTYTSFDPPGAVMTYPIFITNNGVVGGYYTDGSAHPHGFIMTGGAFTTVEPPGAVFGEVSGIGPAGEVVGTFANSGGYHGFIEQGGTFYSIDVPGSTETFIQGVNAKGSLVGNYWSTDSSVPQFGFIARCPADQSPCTQ